MLIKSSLNARRCLGALIMSASALLGHISNAMAQNSSRATGRPSSAKSSTKAGATKSKSSPKAKPGSAADGPVWPVANIPETLPGSILPAKRIVAFYGNPLSKGMGILGALPPDEMLAKLDKEVALWNAADPDHPVQPALHLIAVVAQNSPGTAGKYRLRIDSAVIAKVYGWAKKRDALLFLDVQVGTGTLQEELPRLIPWLKQPDIHLAIDPEFSMKRGNVPGTRVGTFDAADINYASDLLADLVTKEHLPPKVFVVHRWTRDMLTGYKRIKLDSRVQMVIDMDGWGPPSLKRESYRVYVAKYPVEYTGFKLFYHNDTKGGSRLMSPADVLALHPKPLYIQYQ
jgi:hypothetical protein